MSKETQNDYMLLFRNPVWHRGLSPEEMQQVANQWMTWFNKLTERGVVKGGHPLAKSGKIVSGKNGRVVADGPFAESKEAIGGYFMLQGIDLEEAVAIAKGCPGLAHGVEVEVRPVLEVCPLLENAQPEKELAGAAA